jgi:cytochrome P450
MCKRLVKEYESSTEQPMVTRWSPLIEHIIKVVLYTYILSRSVARVIDHSILSVYSKVAIYSLAGLYALSMVKNELNLIIKRIQGKLPPGYLGFPILREINFFRTVANGGVMKSLHAKRNKYGTLFTQSFFGGISIIAGGQDDLNWLFNNDRKALTEIAWPPNIVMLLGPGAVANQTGSYHRVLRRLLEPYFAPKFVENYLKCMDDTTSAELESWSESGEFHSSEVFKMYALRLFYVSAFGNVDEVMIASLHDDFKLWLGGFLFTTKQIPGTSFTEAVKARERILNTVDILIDKFISQNPENSERAQITIMGRLIYGKDKDDNRVMTRDEMKDNILNLIFAGHDTTYASISTLMYHLSENKDAMDALVDEVSTLSDPLTADELKNAPVLNACMHESWRCDPPVAGSFRKAVKELYHKGYSFNAGTVFNYSILMATTDEKLYKRHEKFDMRRFLPKDHKLYSSDIDSGIDPLQGRSSYPIFGGGTHVCLGKAFAQLELRVLAARLLQGYKVEVRNPEKVYFPVNGWKIEFKLTKRKSQ